MRLFNFEKCSTIVQLTCMMLVITIVVLSGKTLAQQQLVQSDLSAQPLSFTENQGQWVDSILFRANAGSAIMWFTKTGAYYQFTRQTIDISSDPLTPEAKAMMHPDHLMNREPVEYEIMMIKASFVNSKPNPVMRGEDIMEYKCNYFLGNDESKWRTDVPNYTSVIYEDIYAGIDLKYYGNGKQMEYDFIVSPGADFTQIQVQYEGSKSLSVNDAGELVIVTDWGTVTELKPLVYQMEGEKRIPLQGEYTLLSENTFGFDFPGGYNEALALVIDPVLKYSTQLGGPGGDIGYAIAVDANGNAYVTGSTTWSGFPIQNPYQATYSGGSSDVIVTKLSASGNSLIYSTYLGGTDREAGRGIAVDANGNAYLTGHTESSNFPTQNPIHADRGLTDAFVAKLSAMGNTLVYSTYLGGGNHDLAYAIDINTSGNAYVAGETRSTDFPTQNPYQGDGGGSDAFVAMLSTTGNSLVYGTYLGGGNRDEGFGIAVDIAGNAYITGVTLSGDFPVLNPYHVAGWGPFVTKLSTAGSLVYSTYLGGSAQGNGIAVDLDGNAYVTGYTNSSLPTVNPFQLYQGGFDAFVTKLNPDGNIAIYSTYLGGNADDKGWGIAADASGNAYILGLTNSTNFPILDPFQATIQDIFQGDAFITKLSSDGSTLEYGSYLGGTNSDQPWGIVVDDNENAYVTGQTNSIDFPIQNPYQSNVASQSAFITKIGPSCCLGVVGDANLSLEAEGEVSVGDITVIVDFLFGTGAELLCLEEADANQTGGATPVPDDISVGDITAIVDHLFGTGAALPDCL